MRTSAAYWQSQLETENGISTPITTEEEYDNHFYDTLPFEFGITMHTVTKPFENKAWDKKPFGKAFKDWIAPIVLHILLHGGNTEEWNTNWLYFIFSSEVNKLTPPKPNTKKEDYRFKKAALKTAQFFELYKSYNE